MGYRPVPYRNYELTQAMMQIIRNGGLGNGGTNFDAKTRRNSTDLEDIFIAHIAGMDAMRVHWKVLLLCLMNLLTARCCQTVMLHSIVAKVKNLKKAS